MDILRYTNPPQREREQFKIIKPPPQPGFDDTATSIKDTRTLFSSLYSSLFDISHCFYISFHLRDSSH